MKGTSPSRGCGEVAASGIKSAISLQYLAVGAGCFEVNRLTFKVGGCELRFNPVVFVFHKIVVWPNEKS